MTKQLTILFLGKSAAFFEMLLVSMRCAFEFGP